MTTKAKKRKDQTLARLNEPSPETKRKIKERDLKEDEQSLSTDQLEDEPDKEDASDEKAEKLQTD